MGLWEVLGVPLANWPPGQLQADALKEPVEVSMKVTESGAVPEVGLAVKPATGAAALAVTLTVLLWLPATPALVT